MPKLTKAYVERLPVPERETFVWDDEIKGFGLKLFPSGARSFVFQYRTPEGKVRRLTIGKFSDALTADQARRQAKGHAMEVHGGRDPQGEKQERRRALTLGQLFDEYLESEAFLGKADSTRMVDRGRISRHLRPLVGTEYVDRLTAEAVKRMHRQICEGKTAARIKTGYRGLARVRGGTGTADKAVLLLSAVYKWATDQRLAKGNPAGSMKCWKTGERDTILETPEQYRQLFTALQDLENEKRIRSVAADAIRFIALTGARRGEAVGLRWRYVDLKNGQVILPPHAHKTGKKTGKPRIIGLPVEAQAIIARQADGGPGDYVFSPHKDVPISLNKDWPKVRERAGLPADLGLHGLRHSIGTALAMSGASAVELMELLGHRQISTTMRYVHFAERARSTLAERAAAVALAGMKPEEDKAEVIPLKKGKL